MSWIDIFAWSRSSYYFVHQTVGGLFEWIWWASKFPWLLYTLWFGLSLYFRWFSSHSSKLKASFFSLKKEKIFLNRYLFRGGQKTNAVSVLCEDTLQMFPFYLEINVHYHILFQLMMLRWLAFTMEFILLFLGLRLGCCIMISFRYK